MASRSDASDPLEQLAAARPRDPHGIDVEAAAGRIEGRLKLRGAPVGWLRGRRLGWAVALLVALGVGVLAGGRVAPWGATGSGSGSQHASRPADAPVGEARLPVDGSVQAIDAGRSIDRDDGLARTVAAALAGDGLARTRLRGAGPAAAEVLWRHVTGGGAPGAAAVLRRRMPWSLSADEARGYAAALGARGQTADAGPVALLLWVRGGAEGQHALSEALAGRLDLMEAALAVLAERARAGARWRSLVVPLADRSAVALAAALDVARPADVGTWNTERIAPLLARPLVQQRLRALSPVARREWVRAAERGNEVAGVVVGKARWSEGVPLLEATVRRAPLAAAMQAVADLADAEGVGCALALARLAEDAALDGPVRRAAEQALGPVAERERELLEDAARRQHGVRFAACRALARAGSEGLDALVRLTARGTTREQALGALAAAPLPAADERLVALIDGGGVVGAESLRHLVARLEREPSAEEALVALLATRHREDVLDEIALSEGEHARAFLRRHGESRRAETRPRAPTGRAGSAQLRGDPAAPPAAPPDPRPPV
ncbi:MAG: hypothetical protein AB7T63_04870 [Planctomycetota bacterium]